MRLKACSYTASTCSAQNTGIYRNIQEYTGYYAYIAAYIAAHRSCREFQCILYTVIQCCRLNSRTVLKLPLWLLICSGWVGGCYIWWHSKWWGSGCSSTCVLVRCPGGNDDFTGCMYTHENTPTSTKHANAHSCSSSPRNIGSYVPWQAGCVANAFQ